MSLQTKKQKLKERRHKKEIRRRFGVFAVIFGTGAALSLAAAAYIAGYEYASLECAIAHEGASAPAYTAFLSAITPAAIALVLSAAFAVCLYKNKKN